LPDQKFPVRLEIQFAPHLEILCWFRFGQCRWKPSRLLNAAQFIKKRIERPNAVCELGFRSLSRGMASGDEEMPSTFCSVERSAKSIFAIRR
jgi:hypothetical protein